MAKAKGVKGIKPVTQQDLTKQAYNKELRRIKQFIRRVTKRGYIFEENIIPKKPKKITQSSVNRLKKITPSVLYEKSTAVDPLEGGIVKGTVARKQERKVSARKAVQTKSRKNLERVRREAKQARDRYYRDRDDKGTGTPPSQIYATLENVREQIRQWTPQTNWTTGLSEAKRRDVNILENILNGAIAQQGEEAVGKRLEENSLEINALLQEILYGSGSKEGNFKDGRTQVNFDLARFSAIVMGRPLTVEESIDLTDLAENLEVNN